MIIKKFLGRTEAEAIEKAKKELGGNAVIMNVKEVKPKGIFRFFQKTNYEVTAAMEEKDTYQIPQPAAGTHDSINMTADEKIVIPAAEREQPEPKRQPESYAAGSEAVFSKQQTPQKESFSAMDKSELEQKLENLQSMLEKQLSAEKEQKAETVQPEEKKDNIAFVKVMYDMLLNNEVDEKYINQILDEMDKSSWGAGTVDLVLSNVYQKLILKFGQPKVIELSTRKPKVVFLIGPTGVGKTTTLAKIASKFKVEEERKVAFITADTYRIAAAEQLRTYANILNIPMEVIFSPEELNQSIEKFREYDLVLVDTAGFSHKNQVQKEDIHLLVESVKENYDCEVYLVVSATTKYKDLLDIAEKYKEISDYRIIFTKLDETSSYGNILNMRMYSGADLSYITYGQNVPDDMEVFNTQMIVKNILGGK